MRAVVILLLALATAAAGCSRRDEAQAQRGVRSVVADIKAQAHKVASDPGLRKAGAQVKKTAAEAGQAIKHTATQAKDAAKHGSHEARRKGEN